MFYGPKPVVLSEAKDLENISFRRIGLLLGGTPLQWRVMIFRIARILRTDEQMSMRRRATRVARPQQKR